MSEQLTDEDIQIHHWSILKVSMFNQLVLFHIGEENVKTSLNKLDAFLDKEVKENHLLCGEAEGLMDQASETLENFESYIRGGHVIYKDLFVMIHLQLERHEKISTIRLAQLSHECVHAAERIMKVRGVHEDQNELAECLAYLQEHLFIQTLNVLGNWFKKENENVFPVEIWKGVV